MPFNRDTASKAGKKSKRGNAVIKSELKIKLGQIFNDTLDSIAIDELTMSEKIKLLQISINYVLSKEIQNDINEEENIKSIVFMPA